MRQRRSGGQKINLASLAAAVAIVGFVGWMAGHAAMPGSLYANDHPGARSAEAASAPRPPAHSPAPRPNLGRAG
jgi:hypothetical protein